MCLMPCLRMAVLIRVLLLTSPRKARSVSRIWRTPGVVFRSPSPVGLACSHISSPVMLPASLEAQKRYRPPANLSTPQPRDSLDLRAHASGHASGKRGHAAVRPPLHGEVRPDQHPPRGLCPINVPHPGHAPQASTSSAAHSPRPAV